MASLSAFVHSSIKTTNCFGSPYAWSRAWEPRKAGSLVQIFRTPQSIFPILPKQELRKPRGWLQAIAQTIASGCAFEDAVTQQQKALQTGTEIIPITDHSRYPQRLKTIFDP